jgi:hypothetical protein
MTIYSLDQILELIIKWEKRLDDFYDIMEDYLASTRSRKAVIFLQERQQKVVDALAKINIAGYKNTEYIQNIPDYHSEELIPHFEIDANSSPSEIFQTVLGYEQKLELYYTHLRDVLVYAKSKELFDMLLRFKMGQIKEIKEMMDSYDLVL